MADSAFSMSNQMVNFTATAGKTVGNTSSETSTLGTGVGSKTIAANTLVPGNVIRIVGGGVYSTQAVAPGNCTVKVKLGTTVIASTTITTLLGGISASAFDFSCRISVRSVGASGSVVPVGGLNFASTSGSRIFGDLVNGGSAVTVDTTADLAIDVTVTWSVANASNTETTTSAQISLS